MKIRCPKCGEEIIVDENGEVRLASEEVQEVIRPAGENSEQEGLGAQDELFARALQVIWKTGLATISIFQRELGIGYTEAAELLMDLEKAGFVGPQLPDGVREIHWDKFPE
ncbi:MAG: hypothetical protein IKR13_06805 [Victivallales bacterium]|nr:hypothetical protein [Victivallales bacterium]